MTELTPARFAELADAYGGAIARWPETVRGEAMRMTSDPAMRALLEQADTLDARLDAWRIALPSAALVDRVTARAPKPRRRLRLWWSGIGIATALAGAAAGSIAVAATTPASVSPPEDTTAFGELVEV